MKLSDGREVTVTINIDAQLVDNGIGGYEFWGSRGTHSDWCWECNVASVEASEAVDPLELNEMIESWVEDHQEELGNQAAELAGDLEADYPELDPEDSPNYEAM